MKVHVLPPSPRAIKVLALQGYLGISAEIQVLDYFKAEQASPPFATLNPNRRQPVLEQEDWVLWESNAIVFYLAGLRPEAGLWPSDLRGQADVLRWMFWESSHWDPACDMIITERLKKPAFVTRESGRRTAGAAQIPAEADEVRLAEGGRYLRELAKVLDDHLRGRTWLLGDGLSIADFALGAWMPAAAPAQFPLDDFEEISRWAARFEGLPGWNEALAMAFAGSPAS